MTTEDMSRKDERIPQIIELLNKYGYEVGVDLNNKYPVGIWPSEYKELATEIEKLFEVEKMALKEIIELAKTHSRENYNISLILNKAENALKPTK